VRVEDLPGRATSLCEDHLEDRQGPRVAELPPCPSASALNASAARLAAATSVLGGVNHEHTGHSGGAVTWALLAALDPPSAALAAHAARRYGYATADDEDNDEGGDEGNGGEAAAKARGGAGRGGVKEACRFRGRDARWTCALVRTDSGAPS
jgi:hypothetical protein